MPGFVVCTLYKFVHVADYMEMRKPWLNFMLENRIKGTLLLAEEGINGTVAGNRTAINKLLAKLRSDPRFRDIRYKESIDDRMPFNRTRVKIKKEIVTMGVEGINPAVLAGSYVKPKDWNALISDPDVLLVDTRNDYEVNIGSFKNAINPVTTTFREFPKYVQSHLNPAKHKKIAMFCTGGIRCEKSTAYLKQQGFDKVYHLQGGILKYFEEVPQNQSLWEGECFVFDGRVSVNHRLEKGRYQQCNACRMPITESDMANDKYQQGVSCPHCYGAHSTKREERFLEREKQVALAKLRGEQHIGSDVVKIMWQRRKAKLDAKHRDRQTRNIDSNSGISN